MDERAPQSSHCNYFVQNHVKLKTMPTTYRPRRVDGETIKPRLFDATSPIIVFKFGAINSPSRDVDSQQRS